ncbi:MAG: hypothetical protein N2319_00160 [Candidatus Kapabacteria bacterium]|nr:hypothetical protein [Candidatus Kapabacteria bacterium]
MAEKGKSLTLNDLIKNFREALIVLIPVFRESGILWNDDEMNEDFEGISEALFKWMVIYKIEQVISEKYNIIPTFPQYNYYYKSYAKLSFIEVYTDDQDKNKVFVFLKLKSKNNPYDTVVCNLIDKNGNVLERDLEIDFNKAKYRFHLKKTDQ